MKIKLFQITWGPLKHVVVLFWVLLNHWSAKDSWRFLSNLIEIDQPNDLKFYPNEIKYEKLIERSVLDVHRKWSLDWAMQSVFELPTHDDDWVIKKKTKQDTGLRWCEPPRETPKVLNSHNHRLLSTRKKRSAAQWTLLDPIKKSMKRMKHEVQRETWPRPSQNVRTRYKRDQRHSVTRKQCVGARYAAELVNHARPCVTMTWQRVSTLGTDGIPWIDHLRHNSVICPSRKSDKLNLKPLISQEISQWNGISNNST